MKVYLNEITGIADAISTLYFSKRSWNAEKDADIRRICNSVLLRDGSISGLAEREDLLQYNEMVGKLLKWGRQHITMLRYIDFSFTVEGLHRGGQDDWDAHAMRFSNRIIRSSTRLGSFGNEMSDWYKEKIIPTDEALQECGISIPASIVRNGQRYVKAVNGYIREDLADNQDVKRGLYMLSIPSSFVFKVSLTEFAHVYKLRGKYGHAHPEVIEASEQMADELCLSQPLFTRNLLMQIQN